MKKPRGRISVTRVPGDDVRISIALGFKGDDKNAAAIYTKVGELIAVALPTEAERREFLDRLEAAKVKAGQ